MRSQRITVVVMLATILSFADSFAQDSELFVPHNFQQAYKNNTRSASGLPGEDYWQNKADYTLNIDFDPQTRLLKGEAEIAYFNNSPDTLNELYINLLSNFYKKGQVRDYPIAYPDESDGVTLEYLSINSSEVDTAKSNENLLYGPTNVKVNLDAAIAPGEQVPVKVKWHYILNKGSHNRTGAVDSSTYFIAYFFPHIAVYDDIDGWDDFHFKGDAEFYNDFGNFDVHITVPVNFVVWGTGLLQNADKVLQQKYVERYQAAQTSDNIIHIIDSTDVSDSQITTQQPKNVWHFKAEHVSDFAFATSDHYLWDASSLVVDTLTGRRVLIDGVYNKNAPDYYKVAEISRHAVQSMSFDFPGVPFPFPQITVFEGLDEMEYPMMVNNHSVYHEDLGMNDYPNNANYSIALTTHEIFHSYFPFYMGINESKYAWMDEGWAAFGDYAIATKMISNPDEARWGEDSHILFDYIYHEVIGSERDQPIFNTSKMTKRPTYSINSYVKPAVVYRMMQEVLGEEDFKHAIQVYMQRWNGKHPMPYDFFYTLNQVSGQDLTWLIKPWFFEYGYPDLAINKVSQNSGKYTIEIERLGRYPINLYLTLTFEDGSTEIIQRNASIWKDGSKSFDVNGKTPKKIQQVELGNILIPDADQTNNTYVCP